MVATSASVAATTRRGEKVAALAERLAAASPDEVALAARFLAGERRQQRLDIGWAGLKGRDRAAAPTPTLTLADVDLALERVAGAGGAGSRTAKERALDELLARATAEEQRFLAGLVLGELRQGALAGLLVQAVAAAAQVPVGAVRRALMLDPDIGEVARLALAEGTEGLAGVALTLFRPVQPMLASTAASVVEAFAAVAGGGEAGGGEAEGGAAVEWKLDGTRVQVHRRGRDVRVFSRGLRDVTARSTAAVAVALALDVEEIVLDGELLGLGEDGRPVLFQDTMRGFSQESGAGALQPWFFDVLRLDGQDLLDAPADRRAGVLAGVVGASARVPRVIAATAEEAEKALAAALAAGHEGVVVKALDAPYAAGRRGGAWRKVKPVHTLDLVVLAVEWGSGRRQGWLSNVHLGAREGDGFVMLGKTFKGMTDAMLAWQTERFLAIETSRRGHVVTVRPEQVVEIAVDGVQRSTRYPGGLALRFARVVRYRDDKPAAQADTLERVRELFGPEGRPASSFPDGGPR